MRAIVLTLLLPLAGIAPPAESLAAASAHVSLSNGRSITLEETGYANYPFVPKPNDLINVRLSPGESFDFSFDYAISVMDDGLPVEPLDPRLPPQGCAIVPPGTTTFCGPPSGVNREQAAAFFTLDPGVGRTGGPPDLRWSFDGPSRLQLQTSADSFASALSQSETIHLHVTNAGQPGLATGESISFLLQSEAWVLASPVPEPAAYLLLLPGLAGVLAGGRRRKGKSSKLEERAGGLRPY